jgi:hypothetical protein
MHSHFRNGITLITSYLDFPDISTRVLDILGSLAFISVRFGYNGFDEWNFVSLAAIDILSAYSIQATLFIENRIPSNSQSIHPSSRADTLFFLDTLEHIIPILSPSTIHTILPVIQEYLSISFDSTLRAHLESAHSVFLAILARGDILHDQILIYISQVYMVLPLEI